MSSDNPQWFVPKRYGYGAGLPIRWQGWAVTLIYAVIVLSAAIFLGTNLLTVLSIVVPATLILIIISARTTRGGWRWRWGEED